MKFIESEQTGLLLGKLLVKSELITEKEQQAIIDFSQRKGTKLGQELVEQGFLSTHELSHVLELQMKLKLLNGVKLTSGPYVYEPNKDIKTEISFNINPIQVLYEAVDGNIFLDDYNFQDDDSDIFLYPSLNFYKIGEIILSSNNQYKVVDMLKDPISLAEVKSKSSLDKVKTSKLVKFLKLVQFIRVQYN